MLNDKVVPFFHSPDVSLLRILTDRGIEYFGAREHHEFQLYLSIEDIDHTRPKAKSPQTNGICERFHRTMQEEFYAIGFRKKMYNSVDELQADVDLWLEYYNNIRAHSGRHFYGKTPIQTFTDAIPLAKEKMINKLFFVPINPGAENKN